MTEAIVFTIPHRLVRLNEYIRKERGNKYAGAKVKREQTNLCSWYIPKIKLDYPIEITYIWTVHYMSNDLGNVGMGNKFIEDAMVKRGFIPDDNLKWIKRITHEFRKGKSRSEEMGRWSKQTYLRKPIKKRWWD